MSVPSHEDVAGFEVTMDDAFVVEFEHGQGLHAQGVL